MRPLILLLFLTALGFTVFPMEQETDTSRALSCSIVTPLDLSYECERE